MHFFGSSERIILAVLFSGVFLFPSASLFADVFAPPSCGSLYSTDLVTEMSHEIDYRIEGLTASDATKNLFTTRGTDTNPWTRGASVWTATGTPLDFSGVSPWNSDAGYTKGGTLITPRHIVLAHHYPIAADSTIVFVTEDNTIVTRTLVDSMEVMLEPELDDIELGVLNADVPASVAFYPIISKPELEALFSSNIVPIVIFDQEDKALISEMDYSFNSYFGHVTLAHAAPPATSTRYAWSEDLVNGDSGKPAFFLAVGQPLLALTTTGVGYGPFYGAYVDAINSAILTLGNDGGYQVSTYDFTCFGDNVAPVVTDDSFTIAENSPAGTSVGTVAATDANVGDILSYAIISGNTGDTFAIDAATGDITVADASLLDYETSPSFSLVVEVTDDWIVQTSGTGTISVMLDDALEPPTVATAEASPVGQTSATLHGFITAIGVANPTERGFTHGTTTAYGATTTDSGDFSTGAFSTELTGRSCGTEYHFQAYATNSEGTDYGGDVSFTTTDCEDVGGGGGGGGRRSEETGDTVTVNDTTREALIVNLRLLIAQFLILGGTPTPAMSLFLSMPTVQAAYARDLEAGDWGDDVINLQHFLILQNKGPHAQRLAAAGATGYFGSLTRSALAEFQASTGIEPAVGYFGPKTRALVEAL